jgi:membrane protein implicated in regulation of membrane protease activity
MEFLPPLSAFTVFLAIAAVGFLFLVIALIFGEIFDFFDHDTDFEIGGPGIFSTRVIAVFITAFGGFGAIATRSGATPLVASLIGLASGVLFGGAILLFARFLFNQQASSDVRSADLVGQNARVIVAIPPNGVGQIRCRIGEELVDKVAQSRDGSAIGEHATVRVDTVLGETVIVTKV